MKSLSAEHTVSRVQRDRSKMGVVDVASAGADEASNVPRVSVWRSVGCGTQPAGDATHSST